jgi:hypothetical protein
VEGKVASVAPKTFCLNCVALRTNTKEKQWLFSDLTT